MMRKKHDNIRLYHVDHLGSTTLVTDIDGEITQHVAFPYGEVFVEERNGVWKTAYLFNENGHITKTMCQTWSIIHDHDYDEKGAKGMEAALFNTSVIGADFKLAGGNLITVVFNDSWKDRGRSLMTTIVFGLLGTCKSMKYLYECGSDMLHDISDGIYEFNRNFNSNFINNFHL